MGRPPIGDRSIKLYPVRLKMVSLPKRIVSFVGNDRIPAEPQMRVVSKLEARINMISFRENIQKVEGLIMKK